METTLRHLSFLNEMYQEKKTGFIYYLVEFFSEVFAYLLSPYLLLIFLGVIYNNPRPSVK